MIIHKVTRYFTLQELVSKAVWLKYGEQAWSFFDIRLLDVLVWLREGLGIPLVCNTSTLQQRGYRENTSAIVRQKTTAGQMYASAHTLGKGVDLSSGKMSATAMRQWIRQHQSSCPHPIRIESDCSAPTWLHIDVCNISGSKLQEFNA